MHIYLTEKTIDKFEFNNRQLKMEKWNESEEKQN